MKLTAIMLLIAIFQVHAGTFAQRVSLSEKNAPLIKIFDQISSQTGYDFLASRKLLRNAKPVSINVKNEELARALEMIFKGQQLEFSINDKAIVVTQKETSLLDKIAAYFAAINVKGKVVDENGRPLPGASVMVKGTKMGSVTNTEGLFSLNNVPDDAVLVISFVGYRVKEIAAKADLSAIQLSLNGSELNELVVVGYGTQSKRKLTTSVSKVSARDIGVQPITTPGEALAGLASGVQVQSSRGGFPGEAPAIRIRGLSSIGAGLDVLYVVDGYVLPNADNFNQINPSDIESMEVLKDAAAAAIYGARAGNGVVIVTTKRGKEGKTKFDVSASTGIQETIKRYDLMNKDEYLDYAKRAAEIRGVKTPDFFNNSNLPNTDWQDLIFRTAMVSNYNLSAGGGSEKVKYVVSGGYLDQDGTLKGTGYKRMTLRTNLDADLSDKLKLGISFAPSYSQQFRLPTVGQWNNTQGNNSIEDNIGGVGAGLGRSLPNVLQCAYLMVPVLPSRNANGDYAQPNASPATSQYGFLQSNMYNPLAAIENVTNRARNYRILANNFLEWTTPVKNLKLKTAIGATLDVLDQYVYIPAIVSTNDNSFANVTTPAISNIYSSERTRRSLDWLWENTANYQTAFGSEKQHSLSALAFFTFQKFSAKELVVNGTPGTYTNSFVENPLASNNLQGNLAYGLNDFTSVGGRLTYDYLGKYMLTAAFRSDASSKFGPNNRFGTFPSVSAAWRVIDEKFMEGTKSWLSDLKLRASYGETGNANIGDFTWANKMDVRNYVLGGIRNPGAFQSGFANPDLTWEKNRQNNYGIDFGILNNKITLSADYYVRKSEGMLLSRDLPGILGYARDYKLNTGSIENKGLELNLSTNFNLGAVRYTADYNFSTNSNKLLSLGGPSNMPPLSPFFGYDNVFKPTVGDPIGNMYGFVIEGVFKNQADLAAYPQWNGNGNLVGDYRIWDKDGNGRIDEGDRTLLGNGIPKYTYATTQRFAYKGFDLTIILQGVQGVHNIIGDYRQLYGQVGGGGNVNAPADLVNNYFDPAQPDREVRYARVGANTGVTLNNQATNYSVRDASYLRLRNATLGYTLPQAVVNRLKLQNIKIYASGANLFTITKYPGLNPESSGSVNALMPGVDQGSYPAIRTLTFGVNLSF